MSKRTRKWFDRGEETACSVYLVIVMVMMTMILTMVTIVMVYLVKSSSLA